MTIVCLWAAKGGGFEGPLAMALFVAVVLILKELMSSDKGGK